MKGFVNTMQQGAFDQEAVEWQYNAQKKHWWFKARTRILDKIISTLKFPPPPQDILEIGCGTGPNLEMLSKHGNVKGLEYSDYSLEIVRRTLSDIPVRKGWLPDNIDVWRQRFDLVCCFDVLEHVADDKAALRAIKDVMKENGVLFLALPAYQWLFGPYDIEGGHYRRYDKKSAKEMLTRNGFVIEYSTYINTILFPCVCMGRLAEKMKSGQFVTPKALKVPNIVVNTILYRLFVIESYYIPALSNPFGASLLILARNI